MQGQPTEICEAPDASAASREEKKDETVRCKFPSRHSSGAGLWCVRAGECARRCIRSAGAAAQPTPAQRIMGDIAPKLADLTDNVLFGDVWERPGLSKRDRSLVTVSALIAMNRPDQLRSHLARARDNGMTEQELIEAITHLASTRAGRTRSPRSAWPGRFFRRSEGQDVHHSSRLFPTRVLLCAALAMPQAGQATGRGTPTASAWSS